MTKKGLVLPAMMLFSAACTGLLGDFTVASGPDDASADSPSDGSPLDAPTSDAAPGSDALLDGNGIDASDASHDASSSDVGTDTNPPACGDLDQPCCSGFPPCPTPGLTCDPTFHKCIPAVANDVGKPCNSEADCSAHLCTPLADAGPTPPRVCSERCDPTMAQCPGGSTPAPSWTCIPSPLLSNVHVCTCSGPTGPETCDGKDNDCNGQIDDGSADQDCKQQLGNAEKCVSGQCVCGGATCGGTCVDTNVDPNNCGACGHGCHGGGCNLGKCQPFVVYDAAPNDIGGIAADTSNVYFTAGTYGDNSGVLLRCGTGDGACPGGIVKLQSGLVDPRGIALSGTLLVGTTPGYNGSFQAGTTAYSCTAPGCTSFLVDDATWGAGTASFSQIATDGSALVYYDSRINGDVYYVQAGSTAPTVLAAAATGNSISGIAVANSRAYWLETGASALRSCPLGTTTCTQAMTTTELTTGLRTPIQIVTDGAFMMIADFGTTGSDGSILSCGVPCNNAPGTAASSQPQVSSVAFDSTRVYWATKGDGSIKTCSRFGACTTTVLATGVYPANLFDPHDGTLYFSSGSKLMRLAK